MQSLFLKISVLLKVLKDYLNITKFNLSENLHHKHLNLQSILRKKKNYVCYDKQFKMRANKGLYRIKSPYFGL